MHRPLATKLGAIIAAGHDINETYQISAWGARARGFLRQTFTPDVSEPFCQLSLQGFDGLAECIGYLEGILSKLEVLDSNGSNAQPDDIGGDPVDNGRVNMDKKVFIVHGHDTAAKESIARFIEKIGLVPIILHEQPNIGRTIIEKFERFSDVNYAIVLFTPDDEAYPVGQENIKKRRARQNVVLELGYFIGKLGRKRVCALYVEGTEMPSDFQGILYIKLDNEGGWKVNLAQELLEGGMMVNLKKLL
jgi:predicted nucleotide-binding protein